MDIFDSSRTVSQVKYMEHENKINDIHSDLSDLSNKFHDHDKWSGTKVSATEPNDIEFLEYHYNRLIRKYDVPFEKLRDVKDICLSYLDRKNAEEERKRLAHKLEVCEDEIQRHSRNIKSGEQWLVMGGESNERS